MTNLPLRPDGGIDWDKAMLMVVANSSHNTMHILTAIKREKESVGATLERVAKWHDGQAAQIENLGDQPAGTDPTVCGAKYWAHRNSAATIRKMKV